MMEPMENPYEFELTPDDFVDDSGLPVEDDDNVNMAEQEMQGRDLYAQDQMNGQYQHLPHQPGTNTRQDQVKESVLSPHNPREAPDLH